MDRATMLIELYGYKKNPIDISIKKWEDIIDFLEKIEKKEIVVSPEAFKDILQHLERGTKNCALCELYSEFGCSSCPIKKLTGKSWCRATPYEKWLYTEISYRNIKELRQIAEEELKFLENVKRSFQKSKEGGDKIC